MPVRAVLAAVAALGLFVTSCVHSGTPRSGVRIVGRPQPTMNQQSAVPVHSSRRRGTRAHGPVRRAVLGFWAYNGFYPGRDIVVVVLGNLDTIAIDSISAKLNLLAAARSW